MDVGRLRAALLRWYGTQRRELPWRRNQDPYSIWVAEIMLQQTRVATVIPYYERFLRRFPDAEALAAAGEDEVLSLWSGLGYYRRARALHAGATAVMERHGGRLPRDARALAALPGIGRYTAGAIASTAFGEPTPVLDGNARRVLARIFAVDGARVGRAAERRRLWELAGELVAGAHPGDLNQAVMELGALVCTPRRPACGACPAARRCLALAEGRAEAYPAAERRPATSTVHVALAWVLRGGRVLLERQGAGPLRGRFDLPAREGRSAPGARHALREGLAERHGLSLAIGPHAACLSHAIMNRRLRIDVYACTAECVPLGHALRWLSPSRLDEVPVSAATRKALRAVPHSSRTSSSARSVRKSGHAPQATSRPDQ